MWYALDIQLVEMWLYGSLPCVIYSVMTVGSCYKYCLLHHMFSSSHCFEVTLWRNYYIIELCTWSTTGSSAPLRGRSTCGVSALGRGESTFGSTAPGRGNDFLLYIGEKIFCARAQRIHLRIYRARARKRFSFLYRGEKFLRSGAENPHLDLPRPGAETIFSLYRGEKFLRSGAENPHLDLPRPGAETIFFSI